MTADRSLRIGVVLEAFLDWPLDRVMPWLREHAPDVTDLEIGAGGYAPHPHCDVPALLASDRARAAWRDEIARHGLRIDALNAWGNPLHPDAELAREHDRALRDAIRLAVLLGVTRVVALAGCPPGAAGDRAPHFGAGGWLPYLEGVYERQWEERIASYWADVAGFAAAHDPELRVCLELHPGTCVFNVETFGRVAALGPSLAANLDPSHFFWMGMDGHKVAAALGDRVGHVHGKDTVFHEEQLALNGLLDRRWPEPAAEMPWTFAVPGRGHNRAWWTGLVRALDGSQAQVISIEHEDPFVPATTGVPEAARLLRAAIDDAATEAMRGGDAATDDAALEPGVTKVRVGLVGTGVIAQVMHLHYLAELADRFKVAAVCDLDGESARACAERYAIPAAFTDWRELVAHPLDAVMVLTSGSHAPIAEAAARAGRHVFVEKPMCYSAAEGQAMVAAADQAGVILMVGYPKRYDPAFTRMREETAELEGARMLRVTTSESPLRPYIGHYPLPPRVPLPAEVADGLRADSQERIMAATSTATELERQVYEMVLLDTLVHELNTVRGLLGEPTRLDYASLALNQVTVMLRFGDLPAAIHWIDLPGIARYEMEFALYAPDRRLRLTFPSPFLRNEPAILEIEGGTGSTGRSWRTEEITGYESGFKNELVAFHDSIVTGHPPPTSGRDGLRDVMLCQAIIDSHHRSAPVDDPTTVRAQGGRRGWNPPGVGPGGFGGMESPQERTTA